MAVALDIGSKVIFFGCIVGACTLSSESAMEPELLESEASEELSSLLCELHSTCKCEGIDFATSEQCRSASRKRFNDMFSEARASQLRYDASCAGRTPPQWINFSCRSPNELSIAGELFDSRAPCGFYYGSAKVGESCLETNVFHDCRQGLLCESGTCREPNTKANWRCLNPVDKPDPNKPLICTLLKSLHASEMSESDGRSCAGEMVTSSDQIGDALGNWTLRDHNDQNQDLHQWCDRAVLIVAAAVWCIPCVAEASHLQEVFLQYREQGFQVITLLGETMDGSPAMPQDALEWKTTLGLDHVVLADPGFKVASMYFESGVGIVLPSMMLLQPGAIVFSKNNGNELERIPEVLPK